MNARPTMESIEDKLERGGALFASDEVQLLVDEIAKLGGALVRIHSHLGRALDFKGSTRWPTAIQDAYDEADDMVRL